MTRWLTVGALCFLVAPPVHGQSHPYGGRNDPYAAHPDPRVRRAHRERAVAAVGPVARDLVETHGDEAVAALFACPKPVAVRLAEWHAASELGKLPRPRDLLRVIAMPQHGGDVALWAMQHAGELTDVDSFDAYLFNPLEYALGLKPLAAGAAEARARRLSQAAAATPAAAPPWTHQQLALAGGGLLLVVGLLVWLRKKPAG
jgi:hypothetical protein